MIDDSPRLGRIDLRVLDEPLDPTQADRVIRAALRQRADRATRWIAAAAVLLFIGAGALLAAPRRKAPDEPAGLILAWTASGHVPTNGELLNAFGGYSHDR